MKFAEIPLDKIVIGKSQARIRKVKEDLQELIDSIRVMGLLQPVSVYELPNGKFELVQGQRRFLACQELGMKTIKAEIVEKPGDELRAKMRSLAENLVRKEMVNQDTVDAVTDAFRRYGSIKAVSDETGLSEVTIRKYLKFERLPAKLQSAVKEGEITLNTALSAADYLRWDKSDRDKEDDVVKLAKEMQNLTASEKRQAAEVAKTTKDADADHIITEAKKAKNLKELRIKLLANEYENLSTYSEAEQYNSPEEAASSLVTEGLNSKGYK